MDQGPLVSEQIDSGAVFAREFEKFKPIRVAFWLKENEDSYWYLYIASEQIDDTNFTLAYAEVTRIGLRLNDPNFNLLRVKVIGASDPIAQDVAAMQSQFPGSQVPIRRKRVLLGRIYANEIYVYPSSSMVVGSS